MADGHLLLGGNSAGFGVTTPMPYLLKLTSAGLADCNFIPYDFTVTDVSITLSEPALATAEGISHFDWALNTENITATGQMVCCPPDVVAGFSQLSTNAFVDNSLNAEGTIWLVNGEVQTVEGNILQYNFLPGVNYLVCLFATNACSSDDFCMEYYITPDGVEEKEAQSLLIAPNPGRDSFTLSGWDGPAVLTVRDVRGVVVLQRAAVLSGSKVTVDLVPGLYMLEITTPKGLALRKLVME